VVMYAARESKILPSRASVGRIVSNSITRGAGFLSPFRQLSMSLDNRENSSRDTPIYAGDRLLPTVSAVVFRHRHPRILCPRVSHSIMHDAGSHCNRTDYIESVIRSMT